MMLPDALRAALLAMSFMVTQSPHAKSIQPFKDYASLPSSVSKNYNKPDGTTNILTRLNSLDPSCSASNGKSFSKFAAILSKLVEQAMMSATDSWNRFRNYSNNDVTSKSAKQTFDNVSATPKTTTVTTLLEFLSLTHTMASNLLFRSMQLFETLPESLLQQQINIDDTKSWSIASFLVSSKIIDSRYIQLGTTELVNPCRLHKYDLGYPYGLFSDRFFKSSYVPICLAEIVKKNTCVSLFASPIQFFLDLVESENPVYDHLIPRSDIDEAINMWLFEEQETFKTWLFETRFEVVAVFLALAQLVLLTTVLGKTIFNPSRNEIEIHNTTAIVPWVDCKAAVATMPDMSLAMMPLLDVKLICAVIEIYESVTLQRWMRECLEAERVLHIKNQNIAANCIQDTFRIYVAKARNNSARVIQCKIRQYIAKAALTKIRLIHQQQHEHFLAVSTLQCWARMCLAPKVLSGLISEQCQLAMESLAARKIQDTWRSILNKRAWSLYYDLIMREDKAASMLQAKFRKYLCQKRILLTMVLP